MALVDVIKYDGGPDIFAWKYPNDELGTWTQLIVAETQEALLFKGGQALDLFGPGRHTLETANIPLLNKIVNLPFGGDSPFKAEVWFVNKVASLDVKWGTPTPVQLQDPKYKIVVPVRSYGQFGVQVADSRKFLLKLIGTLPVFDKETLVRYFRGLYLTKVKDAISSYLVHKNVGILEINAYLEELSGFLQERLAPTLEEYGISLLNFFVNDISVPEDDPAVVQLKAALAKRAEMDIVGYNYTQERTFDTLEGAATNPGSMQSGLLGAGLGLGMGAGLGGMMGGQFANLSQAMNPMEGTKPCPKCKSPMPQNGRFCSVCGYDTQQEDGGDRHTITCSNCGHQYPDTVKFCPQCGEAYNPCPYCRADLPEGATTCPQCGRPLPKPCPHCGALIESEDAKFCPQCGQPLTRTCPNCHTQVQDGCKFCPECGTKLTD